MSIDNIINIELYLHLRPVCLPQKIIRAVLNEGRGSWLTQALYEGSVVKIAGPQLHLG